MGAWIEAAAAGGWLYLEYDGPLSQSCDAKSFLDDGGAVWKITSSELRCYPAKFSGANGISLASYVI